MFHNYRLNKKRCRTLACPIEHSVNIKKNTISTSNLFINSTPLSFNKKQLDVNKTPKKSVFTRGSTPNSKLNIISRNTNQKAKKLQITPFRQQLIPQSNNLIYNQLQKELKDKIEKQFIRQVINGCLPNQYSSKFCTFKMDDFVQLLQRIIFQFVQQQTKQKENLPFLMGILRDIKQIISNINLSSKIRKNSLNSFNNLNFLSTDYKQQLIHTKNELQIVCNKKKQLDQEYCKLQKEKYFIISYNKQKLSQIEEQNRQIIDNLNKINELDALKKKISEEISNQEHKLAGIMQESDHILHYVQNQTKNRVVKLAGEHYRQIQSQIYEYAVYLQANQLASCLTYEPLPIQYYNSVMVELEDELKLVNRSIIGGEITLQQKYKSMRDFVLKIYENFNKKSIQQQKIIDFKTRCIIKYVDMMKKWLDNWTLKQEYLVNLRKQFSADTQAYEDIMKRLYNDGSRLDRDICMNLNELYNRIKQNYMMGNSFY